MATLFLAQQAEEQVGEAHKHSTGACFPLLHTQERGRQQGLQTAHSKPLWPCSVLITYRAAGLSGAPD